jgi:CBS domain-containing protein
MVERNEELGDFSATWRVFPVSLLALVIGVICAFVALALLRLIGLFTNLFYFGRWNTALISPVGNRLGLFSAFVPIAGALIIGANAFTVLTLRRSILTEKVARRGYHLSREYAVDPLEILFVREVMRTKIVVLPATSTLGEIWQSLRTDHRQEQRLLPVVDTEGLLVGVLTRLDISERMEQDRHAALRCLLGEVARREVVEAYPDEPFRVVVYRMAEKGVTRMPVVDRGTRTFLGLISLNSAESTHATLGGRTPTRTDAEI